MKQICDHDCFNCKYDDCICDDMTLDDYAEARDRGYELTHTSEQKKIAAYQKAYREANRDEIAAYQKAYREANRDEIAAYQKAYYEANRDEIAAKRKAYREANRDEIAAKRKAYREANRDEIAAYQKAYYEANRDEIAAYQKAYYEVNRDEIAAYQKAYYEANRDEIAAKNAEIKALRKRLKLSQADVAGIFGVSRQLVGFWENGYVECFRFDNVMRKLRDLERTERMADV